MTHDPVTTLTASALERRRLTRAEQLTLTTWRWAFVAVCRQVEPQDLLPQVALQAVLARLRDCTDPCHLFARHAACGPELALVASLLSEERCRALDQDLVDSAFLLRWNELTADGNGPEELPPLEPRLSSPPVTDAPDRPAPGLLDRLKAAWTYMFCGMSPGTFSRADLRGVTMGGGSWLTSDGSGIRWLIGYPRHDPG